MIMHEPDSDIIRWGLDLLNVYPYPSAEYCETNIQNATTYYDEDFAREGHVDTDHSAIENDEMIAHTLQEEFSQLAVAEASGSSHVDEEQSQASVLAQDWFGSSVRTYTSGNEGYRDDGEHTEPCSSGSSPDRKNFEGGEQSLELADDFSMLNDEFEKRLNQMVPIPHVPRINGEIPSVDEATSDHQRLLDRLRLYDLVERKVQGDGNCQFRALSDQFYRTPEHHKFVREQVVNQINSQPENYEGYVPMAYADYLKKMSKDGEWGDHVTLQAAADSYGVKIFVITSFKDTCYIEIIPSTQKSKRVIFLSFWAEVHYNSIYPAGDMPTSDSKKKKRWRLRFGNMH